MAADHSFSRLNGAEIVPADLTVAQVCDMGREYDDVLLIGRNGNDLTIISSSPADANETLEKLRKAYYYIVNRMH